jgi:CheY-like chemotaxis protein
MRPASWGKAWTSKTLAEMLHRFEDRPAGRRLALSVEDDFAAGDIFKLTLQAAGFTPVLLKSGQEAIQYLSAMVPDVVILHLPDIAGVEVLRYVRSVPELASARNRRYGSSTDGSRY